MTEQEKEELRELVRNANKLGPLDVLVILVGIGVMLLVVVDVFGKSGM